MADYSQGAFSGDSALLSDNLQQAVTRLRTGISDTAKYTPTTPGDWADPPPTTIVAALDRLAAAFGTPP